MNATECRSCGATIFFGRGISGQPIPIDAAPVPNGNIVIRRGLAHVLYGDEEPNPGEPRYQSHFVSCPQRRAWRKGRTA